MSKEKNNISTRVYFGASGYDSLSCGYLPNDKIYEYLEKLSKQDLGKPHCARYGFSFTGYPYNKNFKQTLIIESIIENGVCSVYGLNPLCGARTGGGCFRKLKRGECKDPFVVENVGKVFWPDKYGKQSEIQYRHKLPNLSVLWGMAGFGRIV